MLHKFFRKYKYQTKIYYSITERVCRYKLNNALKNKSKILQGSLNPY